MAEWSRKRDGTALGISFGKLGLPPIGFSLVGTVAEMSLDRASGKIRCHNLWCAADVGLPVQPGNVVAQLESSLIFALGSALKERITIKNGVVQQSNFHDYEIMRLSETPQIQRGGHPLGRHSAAGRRARHAGRGAGGVERGVRAHRPAAAQRAVHAEPRQGGAGIAVALA